MIERCSTLAGLAVEGGEPTADSATYAPYLILIADPGRTLIVIEGWE